MERIVYARHCLIRKLRPFIVTYPCDPQTASGMRGKLIARIEIINRVEHQGMKGGAAVQLNWLDIQLKI